MLQLSFLSHLCLCLDLFFFNKNVFIYMKEIQREWERQRSSNWKWSSGDRNLALVRCGHVGGSLLTMLKRRSHILFLL